MLFQYSKSIKKQFILLSITKTTESLNEQIIYAMAKTNSETNNMAHICDLIFKC